MTPSPVQTFLIMDPVKHFYGKQVGFKGFDLVLQHTEFTYCLLHKDTFNWDN